MMALAIMTIVLTGAILADFGAGYWAITAETSNEALFKAKKNFEHLRAVAKQDFFAVVSAPATNDVDSSCQAGALCYAIEDVVTDISPCSKYAEAKVTWQVKRYPSLTTSLFTYLTNPTEAIAEGGDCQLDYPAGDWTSPGFTQWNLSVGNPTGLDFLDGNTYVTGDQEPYIGVVTSAGPIGFSNGFSAGAPLQAIDVARDAGTGRTYAYAAANGLATKFNQLLKVIDVTDTNNPVLVLSPELKGVTKSDGAQGQRVAFYGRQLFLATRTGWGPEFHAFDAGNPAAPAEAGTGVDIGASVNAILVRDQHSKGEPCRAHGGVCRFAYLATSDDQKEVIVLDVTDITNITTAATIDLADDPDCAGSGEPDAKSLALLGNILYVGRETNGSSCANLPDLYVYDVTDPYAGAVIKNQVEAGASVISLRASGPYLFVSTDNGSQQILQVRKSDAADLSGTSAFYLSGLTENGMDFDGNFLYLLNRSSQALQIIFNPNP